MNLGKYSNPNLAQGTKRAILASIIEYLNGEEFVRIVMAPMNYQCPDFMIQVEEDLAALDVNHTRTPGQDRWRANPRNLKS